ncbi:Fused ISPsy20 transposase IstB/transcriptional regulator LysR protein [Pseudomonas savastanoi pv. glycinea]|nr:Fused ISPsy20 transposase IstB/transcriptional regulator LysR protein [Pseudomonas savastanoi pv. glycinea]
MVIEKTARELAGTSCLELGVAADRKLTHLRLFCRLKTDPGVQLLLLTFRAGEHRVISMEMMGKIRRMYFRDKLSLHQIAKRTGLSRNTIRKWIRPPETKQPVYQRRAAFN